MMNDKLFMLVMFMLLVFTTVISIFGTYHYMRPPHQEINHNNYAIKGEAVDV